MADLKRMTLEKLRALAKKTLGEAAARLQTKAELVAALERALGMTGRAAARIKGAAQRAAAAAKLRKKVAAEKPKRAGPKKAAPKRKPAEPPEGAAIDPEGF